MTATQGDSRSLHAVASNPRVQAVVLDIQRLRAAEKVVSDLSTRLLVAEQEVIDLCRRIEKAKGDTW